MNNPIPVHLDLDGVFADFYTSALKILGVPYHMYTPEYAWERLEKVPHFFRDLPMLEEGKELWRGLQEREVAGKIHLQVLSSLPRPTGYLNTAAADKRIWVDKHLRENLPAHFVEGWKRKSAFASITSVLIDDSSRNIHAWCAAGGRGITYYGAQVALFDLDTYIEMLNTPKNQEVLFAAKQESGFFDLPKASTCNDPEHEPPSMLYIPPGKGYRHVCPSCGAVRTLYGDRIIL